jgi:DNA-binding response OmpR family regulator
METKRKLLLIEDDMDLRSIYAEFLSEQYSVKTAENGEDGLTKALAQKFDLILLDLMMPKLDGIGFLRKREKISALFNVPVIVMSNVGHEEILGKCLELGAKYYIIKSNTTPDNMLPIISKALDDVDKGNVKE